MMISSILTFMPPISILDLFTIEQLTFFLAGKFKVY